MWFFGKNKQDKTLKTGKAIAVPEPAPVAPSKQEKVDALLAQMRVLRAEIGEENLQRMAEKLKLETLKKQVRHDIDNDPKKRDRLLDEIRFQARDKGDL